MIIPIHISADPKEFHITRDLIELEIRNRQWISGIAVTFTPSEITDLSLASVKECDLFIVMIGQEIRQQVWSEVDEAVKAKRETLLLVDYAQRNSLHVRSFIALFPYLEVRHFTGVANLVDQVIEHVTRTVAARNRTSTFGNLVPAAVLPNLDNYRVPNLIGRSDTLDAIVAHIKNTEWSYQVVFGQPGVGKTSLLAALIEAIPQGMFCVRVSVKAFFEGRPALVLSNIIKQLIPLIGQEYDREAPNIEGISATLSQALARVHQLKHSVAIIIDEVDNGVDPSSKRRLVDFLPDSLPSGIHIVLSTKEPALDRRPNWKPHSLKPLSGKLARMMIQDLGLPDYVISKVIEKSKGFPHYLHLLVSDIRSGELSRGDLLKRVPPSFKAYLEDLWNRVREDRLFLGAVAIARQPITSEHLSMLFDKPHHEIRDQIRRREALLRNVDGKYELYHGTVRDFVLDELGPIHVRTMHKRFADMLGFEHQDYAYHLFKAEQFGDLTDFAAKAFAVLPESPESLQHARESLTYAFLACKRVRDVNKATKFAIQLGLLSELDLEGVPVDILKWLTRFGHPQLALTRAQSLKDPEKLTRAYLDIAGVLAEQKTIHRDLFFSTVDLAVTSARSLPVEQYSELMAQTIQLVLSYDPDMAQPLVEELLSLRDLDWSVLTQLVIADVAAAKRVLPKIDTSHRAFYMTLISMVAYVSFDEMQSVYSGLDGVMDKVALLFSFAVTQERACSQGQIEWLHEQLHLLTSDSTIRSQVSYPMQQTLRYLTRIKAYDFTDPEFVWKMVRSCSTSESASALCLAYIIRLSNEHCPKEIPWLMSEVRRSANDAGEGSEWGIALSELAAAVSTTDASLAEELTLRGLTILETAGLTELSVAGTYLAPAASAVGGVSAEATLMMAQLCRYDWQIPDYLKHVVKEVFDSSQSLSLSTLRETLDYVHVIDYRSPAPELYVEFIKRVGKESLPLDEADALIGESLACLAGSTWSWRAYITLAKQAHQGAYRSKAEYYLQQAVAVAGLLPQSRQPKALLSIGAYTLDFGDDQNRSEDLMKRALTLYAGRQTPLSFEQLWILSHAVKAADASSVSVEVSEILCEVDTLLSHDDKARVLAVLTDSVLKRSYKDLYAPLRDRLVDIIPSIEDKDVLVSASVALALLLRSDDLDRALWVALQIPPNLQLSLALALVEEEIKAPESANRLDRICQIIGAFSSDEVKFSTLEKLGEISPGDTSIDIDSWLNIADSLRQRVPAWIRYVGYQVAGLAQVASFLGKVDKKRGLDLLDYCFQLSRQVENRSDRAQCLIWVSGCANSMRSHRAQEYMSAADKEVGRLSTPGERVFRGSHLMELYRQAGKPKEAAALGLRLLDDTAELLDPSQAADARAKILATLLEVDEAVGVNRLSAVHDPLEKNLVALACVSKHEDIQRGYKYLQSLKGKPQEAQAFHSLIHKIRTRPDPPLVDESYLQLMHQAVELGLPEVLQLVELALEKSLLKPAISEFREYISNQATQVSRMVRKMDADLLGGLFDMRPSPEDQTSPGEITPRLAADRVVYIGRHISSVTWQALKTMAKRQLIVVTDQPPEMTPQTISGEDISVQMFILKDSAGDFTFGHRFLVLDDSVIKVMGGIDTGLSATPTWPLSVLTDFEAKAVLRLVERLTATSFSFAGSRLSAQLKG